MACAEFCSRMWRENCRWSGCLWHDLWKASIETTERSISENYLMLRCGWVISKWWLRNQCFLLLHKTKTNFSNASICLSICWWRFMTFFGIIIEWCLLGSSSDKRECHWFKKMMRSFRKLEGSWCLSIYIYTYYSIVTFRKFCGLAAEWRTNERGMILCQPRIKSQQNEIWTQRKNFQQNTPHLPFYTIFPAAHCS